MQSNFIFYTFSMIIILSLMRGCVCEEVDSLNLFHLAWTTSADSFKCWRIYVILSIQRNYKDEQYTIIIHSNSLNAQVLEQCPDYDKVISNNIQFWPIDDNLFKETPIFDWWLQHKEFHGDLPATKDDFRYSHLTDLIRLAALWRSGGVYLDFDMLLLRPLTVFYNSFAAQKDESDEQTKDDSDPYNFAVAKFEAKHPFITEVMQHVPKVYDPQLWPCVGPRLITSFVNEWSSRGLVEFHKGLPKDAISNTTTSIHIFPHVYFYPLYWKNGGALVQKNDETSRKEFNRLISTAVTLHIWSRSTNMSTIEKGSTLNILMTHIRDGNSFNRKKAALLSKSRKARRV